MCQYFRSLALTVWELWSFEDLEEKDDLLYQSMTKVFVEQPCYTGSGKYRINQSVTLHVRGHQTTAGKKSQEDLPG